MNTIVVCGVRRNFVRDQWQVIGEAREALSVLGDYMKNMPDDLGAAVDAKLDEGFASGPSQALSLIRTENVHTHYAPGVTGHSGSGSRVHVKWSSTEVSFDDFTGTNENGAQVPGFTVEVRFLDPYPPEVGP